MFKRNPMLYEGVHIGREEIKKIEEDSTETGSQKEQEWYMQQT